MTYKTIELYSSIVNIFQPNIFRNSSGRANNLGFRRKAMKKDKQVVITTLLKNS